MIATVLVFLIETAAGLITVALLLRFLLQWARAPHRNPISDFVNALTNFAVRPSRRIIPGLWGFDLATLVLAWLVQFAQLLLVWQIAARLTDLSAGAIGTLALLAAVMVVRLLLYIIIGIVIVQALLSWVNPYSPLAPLVDALARPFLRPFQRRIRPLGNVDLSPLFVIVICQILLIVLSQIS